VTASTPEQWLASVCNPGTFLNGEVRLCAEVDP
jgi:hypothetical protein